MTEVLRLTSGTAARTFCKVALICSAVTFLFIFFKMGLLACCTGMSKYLRSFFFFFEELDEFLTNILRVDVQQADPLDAWYLHESLEER